MTVNKTEYGVAQDIVKRLYNANVISADEYEGLKAVIAYIPTISETDSRLEEVWDGLTDIPMDPDNETIEEDYFIWEKGTFREDIWHWFDCRYSKGVYHLLYNHHN